MLTEGRNPPSQRVSECRRARERGGVQSGLRSSSLPSWCLCCCGNVCVGAGDKGPLSPTSSLGLIHPSAWNRNSANFAFWAFSEVELPIYGVLRSSRLPNADISGNAWRYPTLDCEDLLTCHYQDIKQLKSQ